MKKIFLVFLILSISCLSFAQIKQRSANVTAYLGIGYKFVFLTNPDARSAYPFFQLSNGDFLKEIDGFFGVNVNEQYAIELAPAYLFTNSVSGEGYYYNSNNSTRYYLPSQTSLFAVPVNMKFKYFPMAKNYTSSLSKGYIMVGGGAFYADEQISASIYQDDQELVYLGSRTFENTFWTYDFEFGIGISSFSKIGYGFELSYRFVPINAKGDIPVITALASNFNSVNFTANIIFTF